MGYWQEPDLGLTYVRARWLDTSTAQWLSADPVDGEPRYSYAHQQPTTKVDPSGLSAVDPGDLLQSAASTVNQVFVSNVARIAGLAADADGATRQLLATYGNAIAALPPQARRFLPPATSRSAVLAWAGSFSTHFLIGFGKELWATVAPVLEQAFARVNPIVGLYEAGKQAYEQLQRVQILIQKVMSDIQFFKQLGLSFETVFLRYFSEPLFDLLFQLMATEPIAPEVLGELTGAVAFQAFMLIMEEILTAGAATVIGGAQAALSTQRIATRLIQKGGRLGKLGEKIDSIATFAERLKKQPKFRSFAKKWMGIIGGTSGGGFDPKKLKDAANKRRHQLRERITKLVDKSKTLKQLRLRRRLDAARRTNTPHEQEVYRIGTMLQKRGLLDDVGRKKPGGGDIDLETPHWIIEIYAGNSGAGRKPGQVKKYLDPSEPHNAELNPLNKKVCVFAPYITRDSARQIEKAGAKYFRTYDELLNEVKD